MTERQRELPEKKYRDADWLVEQHLEKQKSMKQIADECGVHKNTIDYWYPEFEEKRNSAWEPDGEYADKDVLIELYVDEGMSGREIADRYDVSHTTIYHWLDEHGITDGD